MPDYTPPPSSSGGSTSVSDADANTKIEVEESSDENKIRFDTAGSERMIIDETGKVGVGTSSPSAPLHVKSTDATAFSGLGAVAILESTDANNAYGPSLKLFRNSASPADGDYLGQIRFTGQDSAGNEQPYAHIYAKSSDVTNFTEDGELVIGTWRAGGESNQVTFGTNVTINPNLADSNFVVNGSGGSNPNLIFADAGLYRLGIATNAPVATLDVASGKTFRNTRLLTVSVSAGVTLTEAAHAGRYNICAGDITLPSTSTAGEHYAILNTTGGDITIGRNSRNINGAASDFTLGTYKAATCIAIGSNNWMVVG